MTTTFKRLRRTARGLADSLNQVVFTARHPRVDAVIMMDCSQCPIHRQLSRQLHETVRRQSAIVIRHGARPVLFMSWAYANEPGLTSSPH